MKETLKDPICDASLRSLINAFLDTFNQVEPIDQEQIRNCRIPRNKVSHGSFAEFMIELLGEAPGREIDPKTRKRKPLEKDNIVEAVITIDHSHCLEKFTQNANEAIEALDKVLRSLEQANRN